jgi:MoaA/NifB/PqqE/SkfB family radical SAM enzyme
MERPDGYREILDLSIESLFKDAASLAVRNPSAAFYFLQALVHQKKAAHVRDGWAEKGLKVPPIMIASITNRCNLNCKGCYNHAQHRPIGQEMTAREWHRVFSEARDLGISIILLAGGEPLVRPEVLDAAASIPEVVFPVFSNGLLVDDVFVSRLTRARNLIPILSVEGHEEDTDNRRGDGVYDRLTRATSVLHKAGVFFGLSLTVTSANFDTVTSASFVRECIDAGGRLFFYVEYVPAKEGTESLTLSGQQKAALLAATASFRKTEPGLFVAFPGDEEEMGGCVAAGRGFVHVSATGDLEPCPFSPYSDTNLRSVPLEGALRSRFLEAVRQGDERLSRTKGGCALFENREWVRSLLAGDGDDR